MATLSDYLWNIEGTSFTFESRFTMKDPVILHGGLVRAMVHFHLASNAIYLSWFIGQSTDPVKSFKFTVDNTPTVIKQALHDIKVKTPGNFETPIESADLTFTGRVYVYSENILNPLQDEEFYQYAKEHQINPILRGQDYVNFMAANKPPLAFISHSSADKQEIARPIAEGLSKLLCPVWYDEYSLKVGDRLRQSIEKGIKECNTCILIITPNFLNNTGWVKSEFESIFTKELIEQEDSILPVWHNVTLKDVYEYSPPLANRIALNYGELGLDKVVNKLHAAIQKKLKH